MMVRDRDYTEKRQRFKLIYEHDGHHSRDAKTAFKMHLRVLRSKYYQLLTGRLEVQ